MSYRPLGACTHARILSILATAVCTSALLVAAAPAAASRSVPVGIYNVNNSALTQGPSRIYAMRFVLDRPARIYRMYSGMNWEGVYTDELNQPAPVEIRTEALNKGYPSPPAPTNLPAGWTTGTGRQHYAHGNGGTIRARLVPMRLDGTPDMSTVLAEDTYPAVKRYREIKSALGLLRPSGNGLLELRRRFHPRRHPILRHLPEHPRERTRELRVDELARAQRSGRRAERPQHPRQERTGCRGGPRSARGGRMVNRWRRVVGLGAPGWRRLGPRRLHRLWRRRRAPALVRMAGAERRAAPVEPALLRVHRPWQLHPPREVRPCHDEADRGRRVRTRRGLGRRRDGEERAHRADR